MARAPAYVTKTELKEVIKGLEKKLQENSLSIKVMMKQFSAKPSPSKKRKSASQKPKPNVQ